MNFLLSGCQNPDILRIIFFGSKILDIVFIILPIALIVFLIIDLIKMIVSNDDKQSKNVKLIISRIIFSVLIFFVPTIVGAVMNILIDAGVDIGGDYTECLVNANKTSIAAFQSVQDAEDKRVESNYMVGADSNYNPSQNNNNNNSNNQNNNSNNTGNNKGNENSGDLYKRMANTMINVANAEYLKNPSQYGSYYENGKEAWCAKFTTWVAQQTTVNGTNLYNDIIQKENKIQNYKSALNPIYTFHISSNLNFYYSKAYGGTYVPKKGDLIFFEWTNNWNKDISPSMYSARGHIGIVEHSENGRVYTIEGNATTGDGVYKVVKLDYPLDYKPIIGYGSWYK